MGQADFGFLPLHALALASIGPVSGGANSRHHGAVDLGNEGLLRRHRVRQTLGKAAASMVDRLGVVQRDLPDGALAHDDAVVLDKLVHRLGEGPQSDAKSVTARCNRREQPLAFTPALRTNGRSLLLPCRYCGSVTQMSPKVVCQQSFFTLAVCSTAPAYFLLRDANLALGPPLHGLLPQAA